MISVQYDERPEWRSPETRRVMTCANGCEQRSESLNREQWEHPVG